MSPGPAAWAAGLALGFSLIVAIGAQNLFVLRQGLRREHVTAVVAVCATSDAVLVVLGVSGVGSVLQAMPWLIVTVTWAGVAFLAGYGLLAARRAWRPRGAVLVADPGEAPTAGQAGVVGTALSLTWLNPHVYLDTVFLLGGTAARHGDARWWFALGAVVASVVWFTGLGHGARWAGRLFARPTTWRVLDALIAAVMLTLAVSLAVTAWPGGTMMPT